MPRPPILPTIDWAAIFDSGRKFKDWLANAENAENRDRMRADFQSFDLDPHVEAMLNALPRRVNVIAIAEDWCGDVVRHVPPLARLAASAPNLYLRFITREQHPDVFARFLTLGGEAIPKFIFLSDQWVECGSWGPMPKACREWIARGKAAGDLQTARERVGVLYAADPNRRIVVQELLKLIGIAATQKV